MFAIMMSFGNAILTWLLRTVVIKFVLFTALYLVTTENVQAAIELMGNTSVSNVNSILGTASEALKFFFGYLRLDQGLPMLLSAHATAFAIRRLPVVG